MFRRVSQATAFAVLAVLSTASFAAIDPAVTAMVESAKTDAQSYGSLAFSLAVVVIGLVIGIRLFKKLISRGA